MATYKEAAQEALRIEEESSEAEEPFLQSKLTKYGIFSKDANPKFLLASGTALRVSIWVTVYAMIVMLLGRAKLTRHGFDSATVLCNVLFTVGADLGSTINNVFYGVIGSFWAWLVFWVMFGIWPDGYLATGNDDYVWWIGIFIIAGYTLAFMILKVNGNIRFWALLNFTGSFAMRFIDPAVDHGAISTGFSLNWKGVATSTSLLFCAGAALAMLIFLVPLYTSLNKEKKNVTDALISLITVQDKVLRYYCGMVETLQLNNYLVHFQNVKTTIGDAVSAGSLSWFESLGKSSSRAYTNSFAQVLSTTADIYQTALQVVKTEDFSDTHAKMMTVIGKPLKDLQRATHELLKIMHAAAMDGQLDDDEQDDLEEHCSTLPQYITQLQLAVENASRQFGTEPVKDAILGEYYFAFTQCRMAEAIIQAALNMHTVKTDDNWWTILKSTVSDIFAVDKDDLKWAVRSFLAIMINFWVGYKGWCDFESVESFEDMIQSTNNSTRLALVGKSKPSCFIHPYTSGLANINIVLLSRYTAATFKAGLDRCSAVVLANVVGQMGFVAVGWCTDYAKLWTLAAVFFVTEGFMYVNYRGGSFASIGQRLAAMTVYSIMVPCSDEANTQGTYSASYHALSEIIIGVLIMTVIDTAFGDTPSSQVAIKAQLEVIDEFQDAFREYMYDSANADDTNAKVAEMEGKLSAAAAAGADAVLQPTFWRPTWNAEFFQSINFLYSDLCAHLRNLTAAVGDRKKVLFVELQCYPQVQKKLIQCTEFTTDIAKAAVSNNAKDVQHLMMEGKKDADEQFIKGTLIRELNVLSSKEHNMSPDVQGSNLSHRCVTVSELDSLVRIMMKVQATSANVSGA